MQTTEQKQRKTLLIWLVLIVLLAALGASAQTVKKDATGIYCTEQTVKDSAYTRTMEFYKDASGILYPIFVSKNGKYFVIHTSKKSGKSYRHYLKIN